MLHFNDPHNRLTDFGGATKGKHRYSQMVQRVMAARASAEPGDGALFLSVGDDHTCSVLDELLGWRADQFVLDPSYRAYTAAGLDATALGAH